MSVVVLNSTAFFEGAEASNFADDDIEDVTRYALSVRFDDTGELHSDVTTNNTTGQPEG